jgi:hypothetical protein
MSVTASRGREYQVLIATLSVAVILSVPLAVPGGREVAAKPLAQGAADDEGEFLGYQVGEERRYVLGPPEELANAEYALWTARLDSVAEDNERAVFSYTHERSIPLPREYANVHGPSVQVDVEGSVTVNSYGFPLVVEYTAKGSYYQLYDTTFWARYTFTDGRFRKDVRVEDRDWDMAVPDYDHPGVDDSIPAGMFLLFPSDFACMIPPYLAQRSDIGQLRIAQRCRTSDLAFANPGLFSLAMPAFWENGTGEADFLFFAPLGPELYPGVGAGFAGPIASNNMIGAGDSRNYFDRVRLRLEDRETIEVGSRKPTAWKIVPDDGVEAIFVDDEGKVLRIDLGSRPPRMRENWIRLQYPSEY